MAIASWNARQRPQLEEEEENPLVADMATARQGGWSFRGEAVPGPDSVQYDCWVSTHLIFFRREATICVEDKYHGADEMGSQVYKKSSSFSN